MAALMGQRALALTDTSTVAGAVRHTIACQKQGIKPIYGAEISVDRFPLILLCADSDGYANLCDLLTLAHHNREDPGIAFADLEGHCDGLFCLSGDRRAKIAWEVERGRYGIAACYARRLHWLFKDRFFIELVHHDRQGDQFLISRLCRLAETCGIKTVASNAVRHATPRQAALHDALTCARLGLTVSDLHPERPVNAMAFLRPEVRMRALGFSDAAIANSDAIARECSVDLQPEGVTPPSAHVPDGLTAAEYLIQLCHQALPSKYSGADAATRTKAETLLAKELRVICQLQFEEFFLAVREVMEFARSRNIICSGRGSAANSIVAYLLSITYVDPIKNNLLFERFLHEGRKGMPDIDVDFQSDRRDEVIEWMNRRWSDSHTAMTANVVTYRLRGAVRDMMKVLGWPEAMLSAVSKQLPNASAYHVVEHREQIAGVLGHSKALDVLICLVHQLHECPQYLGLHSGGMLLSHKPLRHLTAVQTSAKGVRQIQFNKDDVEWLGATKLDVLSLRMLGALAMTRDVLRDQKGVEIDLDALPFNDPKTYELLRSGRTLGLFQIESPGQMRLLSMTQPEGFDDLIPQVALFRPGPLQGNMVNPYCLRRRGLKKVTYPHPSLIPVLQDTYGIVLYQEQVLEIAHVFADMSLSEADEFRRLMSKFRSPSDMEAMRERFVAGARRKHQVHPRLANTVFDLVAKFVGYGFCRSHAAAFARIVEQSTYLKAHHPDAYLCGIMEHEPGFYPRQTFIEEARRHGIKILRPCLNQSGTQYHLEGDNVIRIPLARVRGVSQEEAAVVVLERSLQPFGSLEDAVTRCNLSIDLWENLARADALADWGVRREELWKVRQYARIIDRKGQMKLNYEMAVSVPRLPALSAEEAAVWDYQTMAMTPGPHPLCFHRSRLISLGAVQIETLENLAPNTTVLIGGTVEVRMRPPTAKGMTFITLRDETGSVQTAITPETFERFERVLRGGALLFQGTLQDAGSGAANTYRSVLVENIWALDAVIGGAIGHPGENPRSGVGAKSADTKEAAQSVIQAA